LRFSISYSRLSRLLLGLLGMGPGRSLVRVDGDDLRVRMGWGFRARIPVASVRSARVEGPPPASAGVGVHGWQGSWVVNGRRSPSVVIELAEPVPARVGPFTSGVGRLQITVDEPEALAAALAPV
jgi:hypothetical protein